MSELIYFLYSEEQGCFHHESGEWGGNESFKLLAKNVSCAKCDAFMELLSFKTGGEIEYPFSFVKALWIIFYSTIDAPDEVYHRMAYSFLQMKNIYLHNNL